jgi:hypothetical protein
MMDTTTFAKAFNASRTHVLNRYADQAEEEAARLRQRVTAFPEHAAEMVGRAEACDRYAADCRAAAADASLPTPSGPNYPSEPPVKFGDDRSCTRAAW